MRMPLQKMSGNFHRRVPRFSSWHFSGVEEEFFGLPIALNAVTILWCLVLALLRIYERYTKVSKAFKRIDVCTLDAVSILWLLCLSVTSNAHWRRTRAT